ncbi:U32 family peptidase [Butyrivibrio sp. VCD2006]|uniref:U32 family peptidase n=1 Tax=Butyrivibrio sp. VCD2006 TaxID=1280664 RepID=UPI00040E0E0E|nr:U32 family peptidase [Butyrivibrio sp. VCD2006]
MRKVELLAPAGNYETMVGAFNAGADAVYLGGQGFGARAFADNFTNEEVVRAIRYAHIQGKKIYLTVNTLLKEKEIPAFKEFFAPFAYAGLDGAIIQDLGIFKIIKESFPWVELHVSTQMTITGDEGASLLMELGASRVVPARELSIDEIKRIHDNCKYPDGRSIEIEAFIHGAMCYCYSGACLFSSMVGERSGNRGRCAQPCRLPYRMAKGEECYPLSLKDMCMADRIPELIEAGIDSFKIEGRMKKPEYAAGVTSVYRKIIDRYYELSQNDNDFEKGKIKLSTVKEDRKILSSLYLRSEIGEGYYFRHNGADMITLKNPAYNGSEEAVLEDVRSRFINGEKRVPVEVSCKLKIGEKAELTISTDALNGISETVFVKTTGDEVQAALKRAMSREDVEKQLSKLGNTFFEASKLDIQIDDAGIFMPNKALNELRRSAVTMLEEEIALKRGYKVFDLSKADCENAANIAETCAKNTIKRVKAKGFGRDTKIDISVLTYDQLLEAVSFAKRSGKVGRIYIDSRIIMMDRDIPSPDGFDYYAALPYIARNESFYDAYDEMRKLLEATEKYSVKGVLVRNTEELAIVRKADFGGDIVTDYGMYLWNHEAAALHGELLKDSTYKGFNLPLELNLHEMSEFMDAVYSDVSDKGNEAPLAGLMIYGRVPMMLTANCIRNTLQGCTSNRGKICEYENTKITDRTGRVMPVTYDCTHCCNIIWNSVPVSLFKKLKKIKAFADDYKLSYRMDFTVESALRVKELLDSYEGLIYGNAAESDRYERALLEEDYTAGHFERSAD